MEQGINPRVSQWLSVDPLAVYNPVMESQFYGDGQHNGGVYNSGNLNPYIYTYNNPVVYVDPDGKQVKISGPHLANYRSGHVQFETWQVNVNTKVINYNVRSRRYEVRSVSNRSEYRIRSINREMNQFYGNETEYLIIDKNGKFSKISTQTEKRVDVAGMISKMYNPVDIDRVESMRKSGKMINDFGDAISEGGIILGPIPSMIGMGIGFMGTGIEMIADYQEGKYNAMRTKGVVNVNSEILETSGDKAIDGSIKNPVGNKVGKFIYHQAVKIGADAVNNKVDRGQK